VAHLPEDLRTDFARLVRLIQNYGTESMHEPHVKHLVGKLWELRLKSKSGIACSIYVTVQGKQLVVLHSFVKKTQQTLRDAIELALRRAKEEGYL
jgi:phage-related protein